MSLTVSPPVLGSLTSTLPVTPHTPFSSVYLLSILLRCIYLLCSQDLLHKILIICRLYILYLYAPLLCLVLSLFNRLFVPMFFLFPVFLYQVFLSMRTSFWVLTVILHPPRRSYSMNLIIIHLIILLLQLLLCFFVIFLLISMFFFMEPIIFFRTFFFTPFQYFWSFFAFIFFYLCLCLCLCL